MWKNFERDAALVPPQIAASPVLAGQVAVRMLVAEIPLVAGSAAQQASPKPVHAGVVVLGVLAVGDQRMGRVARLVTGDDPRLARFGRLAESN